MNHLLSILACPRDHSALRSDGKGLACSEGHEYPVIDGIPVLLVAEDEPTIGIATESLQGAQRTAAGQVPTDPWFTSTVGISAAERSDLLAQLSKGRSAVDPVARFLVAATIGILYRDLVGSLNQYPIPELRLPPGGGKSLLDIGCSWGRWSIAAARKGYRTVGIDPSLGAVLAAKRITGDMGFDSSFVVGDARRLPFSSNQFETVFSYSVLQHFPKPAARASLREIRRVLSPGGHSLIQMPNRFGLRCLDHQMRRGFREPQGFEVRYWSPRELLQAFRAEIGTSRLSVDCFFSLGLQASDSDLMSKGRQAVLRASESLRAASFSNSWLLKVADSLYVESTKDLPQGGPE